MVYISRSNTLFFGDSVKPGSLKLHRVCGAPPPRGLIKMTYEFRFYCDVVFHPKIFSQQMPNGTNYDISEYRKGKPHFTFMFTQRPSTARNAHQPKILHRCAERLFASPTAACPRHAAVEPQPNPTVGAVAGPNASTNETQPITVPAAPAATAHPET